MTKRDVRWSRITPPRTARDTFIISHHMVRVGNRRRWVRPWKGPRPQASNWRPCRFGPGLSFVSDLIARGDLTRAGLRMTFRISRITRYLGGAENVDLAAEKHTAFVDLPTPLTLQNGSV